MLQLSTGLPRVCSRAPGPRLIAKAVIWELLNTLRSKLWDIIKGIKKHTYYLREGRKISKITLLKREERALA